MVNKEMQRNLRLGERHETTNFGNFIIIEYYSYKNCTIKFEDGTILENVRYDHIKEKAVKNPNKPNVFGVGFIGQGIYFSSNNFKKKIYYETWISMLQRCYDEKVRDIFPTYRDVTVCEEWHNFQNFAKWFEDNRKDYMQSWHLDKDILVKGNKIYSPETCCFVPREVNRLFVKRKKGDYPVGVVKHFKKFVAQNGNNKVKKYIGVFDTPEDAFNAYKIAKEEYIKEVADKWKGKITEKVYQAMYNYQVEITD